MNKKLKTDSAAFLLFIFIIILAAPSLSRAYGDSHRFVARLAKAGFIPSLSADASDEDIFDYETLTSDAESACEVAFSITGAKYRNGKADFSSSLPYLRSDMTSGFTENGLFVFPDNVSSVLGGDSFTAAHAYELALRLLGYNSSDFGTTSESVISFAKSKKFGFAREVVQQDRMSNGETAAVLYEALFLPVRSTGYSLARVLAETDEAKKELFVRIGMIEDMPSFAPMYTQSPYTDESFSYIVSLATAQSSKKSEWSCSYSMADKSCYESYKSALSSGGWILDTEYLRTGKDASEICALYYKAYGSSERYCHVSLNEAAAKLNIWLGE